MNFDVDDIVLIVHYPKPEVIGQMAEVTLVRPKFLGDETWYVLVDSTGRRRAAAHSWLRRQDWGELRAVLAFDTATSPRARSSHPTDSARCSMRSRRVDTRSKRALLGT